MSIKAIARCLIAAAASSLFIVYAHADSVYPSRPITLIVPFPPGNSSDISMRLIARYIAPMLKQPVIVENRAGAGGSIGAAHAARQPGDGYTIVMGSTGPFAIAPAMRTLNYDPIKDFVPVAAIAYIPQVIVVSGTSPYHDLRAVISAAKAQAGKLTYASSGVGSTQHLLMAQLASSAGISLTHVPYQGSSPAATDVMSGRIDVMSDAPSTLLPLINSGKLRAIAVTPAQRIESMPGVPTAAEAGVPGYDMQSWILVFAPKGTPAPIVKTLNSDINSALQRPEVKKAFADQAFVPMPLTLAELPAFMAGEIPKWKSIVKAAGATDQ
jgi:tripartite-type tricarboxylate transporter receptor subunit TctC